MAFLAILLLSMASSLTVLTLWASAREWLWQRAIARSNRKKQLAIKLARIFSHGLCEEVLGLPAPKRNAG